MEADTGVEVEGEVEVEAEVETDVSASCGVVLKVEVARLSVIRGDAKSTWDQRRWRK